MTRIKQTLLLLSLSLSVMAQDLDNLLDTYAHNSDLSEKTKLESGGTVTVFTRKDIETMQARNLKDLLKSFPLMRYKESRYGVSDMQNLGGGNIFVSSNVRVYIDNQEFTSAISGSGFPLMGNFNLNVIDHVEIYSQSPSYEFSTEPTYILIKMYSKLASRDRGGKVELSAGSRGFNQESLFYADEFKDFSYVTSVTRLDDKKHIYSNKNVPIKRDGESYSFFGALYSETQKLQVMAGKSDPDTSLGTSDMGTNETSEGDIDYLHIGYETSYFDNTFLSLVYQRSTIDGKSKESSSYVPPPVYLPYPANVPVYSIENSLKEEVLTAEGKYQLDTHDNRLIVGSKLRFKSFDITKYDFNGVHYSAKPYDEQNTYALFAEERYSISDHNIINIAGQYAHVDNNYKVSDADIYQARLSHTYVYNDFVFKSFVYRVESLVEPYIYLRVTAQDLNLDPQVLHTIGEEFKYSAGNNMFKFLFTYGSVSDMLVENADTSFRNKEDDVQVIDTYMEDTYQFNINHKLIANVSYSRMIEMQRTSVSAFIRSLNIFGKFELFNELIYNHVDINNLSNGSYAPVDGEDYYDYSTGVKYHYSDALSLSVKGENIFDEGYEDHFLVVDATRTKSDTVAISPVEQRFYFTLEYLF